MVPIYVRLQVVSGPRDADLSVPSVACERLETASDSKQKKAAVLVSTQWDQASDI